MYRKISLLFLILFFELPILFSQSITGDMEQYLNSIIDNMPGSGGNDFNQPDENQLQTWEQMLIHLFSEEIEQAREKADMLNYQVIEYENNTTTPSQHYYIIEENDAKQNYWGTYVINRNPSRLGLVLQAPHAIYDSNTGKQAVFCFKRLGGLALFISGTHRCNHTSNTSCSGSTGVCGSTGPYKISDNAHNTLSVFQKTTEVLFNENDSSVFVQLHGFGKNSSDPYLIMSNGTRITPEKDYLQVLKAEFLNVDDQLTSKVAHMDLEWTRLIAFTNTQGRYINGSGEPCTQNATECTGRFLHIEQERSRLRADSSGWWKMYTALAETFPVNSNTTKVYKIGEKPGMPVLYPNPTDDIVHVEALGLFYSILYDGNGQCIWESPINDGKADYDFSCYHSGIYFLRVIDQQNINTVKVIVE